jgi:ribonucleotide reductase alpha subunit
VLSNGGTARGLPISCFLNEASDSLDGIGAICGRSARRSGRTARPAGLFLSFG